MTREVRRIGVVPAYNEEQTVEGVLDVLSPLVDELVIVDDGSVDHTRKVIQEWLPGHDHVDLLWHDENQGMSEAYYLALTDLRSRLLVGELDADDLVLTIDADGQHDLSALDALTSAMSGGNLDANLARRDLSGYPAIKRLGNWVMSTLGVVVGRTTPARRGVGVPRISPRRARARARLLPGLPVLGDRRSRGRAVPPRISRAQRPARTGAGVPLAHEYARRV